MAACRHLSAWKAGRGGGGCASGGGDDAGGTAFRPVARALAEHWGRAGEGKVREGKKGGGGGARLEPIDRGAGGEGACAPPAGLGAQFAPRACGCLCGHALRGYAAGLPALKARPDSRQGGPCFFFGRADAPFFFLRPPLPLQPPRPPTPDPLFACLTCAAAADSRADMEAACGDPGTGEAGW